MKTTITLLGLLLGWACCMAQQPDSSRIKRPNLFERRRIQLDQQMDERAQYRRAAREQRAKLPLYKVDSNHWGLSLNPLGILEPQSAIGLGVGYQITQHWQLWLESSYLFQMYRNANPSCLGGVRESLALKYYFGLRQSLFFAGEFRWKQVYYHDVADFEVSDTNLSVPSYGYTLQNIIFGGSLWFGARIRLSNDHRWRLEPSIGLGFKGRTIVRQDVPVNYRYRHNLGDLISPFSDPMEYQTPVTIYLPASVRVVYVL